MSAALEVGVWSAARPGRSLPPGKTRYPFYRRLGGPQDRSGRVENLAPPPGFDPRTVQPVTQSLYRLSYPALNSCKCIRCKCEHFMMVCNEYVAMLLTFSLCTDEYFLLFLTTIQRR